MASSRALQYEETTRVPLLMRLPGRTPAGKEIRTQARSCNLHPTVLDYLGFKPRGAVQGASLRPRIEGGDDLERPMRCERERGPQHFQRLIRTTGWKYCYASNGASQLYNLARDPGETRNLIEEPSARAAREELHARLAQWMRESSDSRKA